MNIKELKKRAQTEQSKKLSTRFDKFGILIDELNKREIPAEIAAIINQEVDIINSFSGTSNNSMY